MHLLEFDGHFNSEKMLPCTRLFSDKKKMSKIEALLEDGLQSELVLQLHLKMMSKAFRQQLQETKMRQTEELDERIYQNSLLSMDRKSSDETEWNYKPRPVGMRRSTSLSALTSDKETSTKPKQRPETCSVALKHRYCTAQPCERFALSKTTQQSKEEEDEAECKNKFRAVPVPVQVTRPTFQELRELREKERKQGHEQRKLFLLSIQKPFSFEEREKNKREKLTGTLKQVSEDPKRNVCLRKSPVNDIKESQQLKDQKEVCRKVHTRMTGLQENPAQTRSPKIRTADRTRKQKLGFLDYEPSFQPKILHSVPNFSRLHKALQTQALGKMQSKDGTKCQPFILRTSARPARKSVKSPEASQVPKFSSLSRSKSLGTLISADTLPTFITDAVRWRAAAIRKSVDLRESKNGESTDWLKNYQMRSQTMTKAVALHAKLLDPHSSLKDVHSENLKRHREADQQRMREYMRELKDMKARVNERPFLFEQVKQRNAKALAEQNYRSKLQKVGLKEQFVEETGESFTSDDDTETNEHDLEDEIQSREENVDDGEKIEDVEEKSVKSKGEETP